VFLNSVHAVPVMNRQRRMYVAAGIGLSAAVFFLVMTRVTLYDATTDVEFWWRASRLWLHGVDPFLARPNTAMWPLPDRLYYPMPALIFMLPLAELSFGIAGAVFVCVSSAWLSWILTESGGWRLWLLATPAFVMAVRLGQWSPLITVAALVPSAGFLLSSNPKLDCWWPWRVCPNCYSSPTNSCWDSPHERKRRRSFTQAVALPRRWFGCCGYPLTIRT
jgi:hypothetical protein